VQSHPYQSQQLQQLESELRALAERAEKVAELAGPRLNDRAEATEWSTAECLVHLRLSSEAYFDTWTTALAEARQQGLAGTGPFSMDLIGRFLAWSLEPPPRFKLKAPRPFQPFGVGPIKLVLPNFLESQDRLIEFLRQADGLALDKVKLASPFAKQIKYNIYSSFEVTAAHQRRHLAQAEGVARRLL
jgi:hypothetical protein